MNTIIILCGGNNSGKTTTLKGFFKVKSAYRRASYIERKLDGRIACALSFGSPQEQEPFCEAERVNENIKTRIIDCENNTKSEQYILLIPFTMSGSRKKGEKVNTDCILKPIRRLEENFKVFVIYLRKINARNLTEKDALMKHIASITIDTTRKDYDRSVELEKFLRQVVMKSP